MLFAAINLAVFLGLRSVLTHSPPCFVTGQNSLRMRPGASTELPMSQRFDYHPPSAKNLQAQCTALLRIRGRLHPSNPSIGLSNQSSLQCHKLTSGGNGVVNPT